MPLTFDPRRPHTGRSLAPSLPGLPEAEGPRRAYRLRPHQFTGLIGPCRHAGMRRFYRFLPGFTLPEGTCSLGALPGRRRCPFRLGDIITPFSSPLRRQPRAPGPISLARLLLRRARSEHAHEAAKLLTPTCHSGGQAKVSCPVALSNSPGGAPARFQVPAVWRAPSPASPPLLLLPYSVDAHPSFPVCRRRVPARFAHAATPSFGLPALGRCWLRRGRGCALRLALQPCRAWAPPSSGPCLDDRVYDPARRRHFSTSNPARTTYPSPTSQTRRHFPSMTFPFPLAASPTPSTL